MEFKKWCKAIETDVSNVAFGALMYSVVWVGLALLLRWLGGNPYSLESLTQVIHEARTDNGSGQGKQRNMNVETTLETDAQFAETGKPGMRALNHPAMPPKLLLAF
jgi:hypothetical protein